MTCQKNLSKSKYQSHVGTVAATTVVKPRVDVEELEAELFYNRFNDTLAQITYTIDDAIERNWYMINVQEMEQEDVLENMLNPRASTGSAWWNLCVSRWIIRPTLLVAEAISIFMYRTFAFLSSIEYFEPAGCILRSTQAR